MFDFKNKFNEIKEKGKGRVVNKSFGVTFNKVKDNKDNTKKKASSIRKKKRVIIIHQRYIICKRPMYKNLKAYYYALPKIAPKGGTLVTYI